MRRQPGFSNTRPGYLRQEGGEDSPELGGLAPVTLTYLRQRF